MHAKLMQVSETIYSVGQSGARVIEGLKCALSCLDICSDFMAEPFHRLRQTRCRLIHEYLVELNLPLDVSTRLDRYLRRAL